MSEYKKRRASILTIRGTKMREWLRRTFERLFHLVSIEFIPQRWLAKRPAKLPNGIRFRRKQIRSKKMSTEFHDAINVVFDILPRCPTHFKDVDVTICNEFRRQMERFKPFHRLSEGKVFHLNLKLQQLRKLDFCLLSQITDNHNKRIPLAAKGEIVMRFQGLSAKQSRRNPPHAKFRYWVHIKIWGRHDCFAKSQEGYSTEFISTDGINWAEVIPANARGKKRNPGNVLARHLPTTYTLGDPDKDILGCFRVACAMQFTDEALWRVRISKPGRPTLTFRCDPVGVRELVMLRNLDGKRRSPVIHWTEEHWREKPDGSFTRVRAHLRGKDSFDWEDWTVQVIPAHLDEAHQEVGIRPSTDTESVMIAAADAQ